MKIAIDLRFLKHWDYYSNFIIKLITNLIIKDPENNYYLFININYSQINLWENSQNIVVNTWNIYEEQIKFKKILDKYHFSKTIFFNYNKPLKYKCNYILFIPNLEEFHFSPKKNIFKKYFDNYLLSENSKNASKIVCFNKNIKSEINDKLNIPEDKIEILQPFFLTKDIEKSNFNIDIRTKYNIKQNYLIYYFWEGESKNFDRIIELFESIKKENINLSLVILDNSTVWNINIRKKIIEKKLNDKIFFIWDVTNTEKTLFFNNSLGVLFPILYSIFPFSLSEAINYNTMIYSSNLKSIKNIFWNKIKYFNQTDILEMYKNLTKINKIIPDYSDILKKYNLEKTTQDLINIIK